MPVGPGSPVTITYDETDDITDSVLFEETSFEAQMAAVPGVFQIVVKDPDRVLSFVTGKEIWLDVDNVRVYGGYILQVTKQYAFPADKTADLSAVKSRQWVLTGVDYNILFDKRIVRLTTDYTHSIAKLAGPITDGAVIRDHFADWFDLPAGFDFSDTSLVLDNHTFSTGYRAVQQGLKMREAIEDLAQYGSIYYIDALKSLHFVPVQDTMAEWGLSDKPNNGAIGTLHPSRGFRAGEMIEDATAIANDALVWGGSVWADDGDVVFSRRENSASITAHKRWQIAEVHVGEDNYKTQAEVTARAKVIVDGSESGTFAEGSKGLVNPETQFRGTWWAHDVPEDSGDKLHLLPGQTVRLEMYVFGSGGSPFVANVPLRQARYSFPELDSLGNAYVQIEGFFGVLMSDPHWLWAFLRGLGSSRSVGTRVATANNSSTDPQYGTDYQGEPSPSPDGVTTVFTIPFGYVAGTSRLYVNGLLEATGSNYTESDPAAGEITLSFAPVATDSLIVTAKLLGT